MFDSNVRSKQKQGVDQDLAINPCGIIGLRDLDLSA
jgi:hypothetical protein